MSDWDYEVDLVVVGSGGGGMTAAIVGHDRGLKTLVVEKGMYYGGTTAISGGVIWVPNNHHMASTNIEDSAEDGLTYLKQVTKGEVKEERLHAYISQAKEMVKYMEDNSHVKFEAAEEYCDYYPELAGGKMGARSLDPKPFDRKKLLDEVENQQPPQWNGVLGIFTLTAKESHFVLNINYKTVLFVAYRLFLHYLDLPSRLKGLPDRRMTLGMGLVGALRRSLMDRDIPLWLNSGVDNLITEKNKVVGVELIKEGKRIKVKANKGVIMAAGGFAKNVEMRQKYQQNPIGNKWTSAVETDTGDGICMGDKIGADLEFMQCAWWTPTLLQPDGSIWALIVGKAMPGSIFVDQSGNRFTNEAAPYEDVVKGIYNANTEQSASIPAYMVFDATFRKKYTIGTLPPSRILPDNKIPDAYKKSDFLHRADSIKELAQKIGVNAEGLEQTLKTHSIAARKGVDELYQRGHSASDRYYSDIHNKPNPCLSPIDKAPFYAVKVYPGDLGTKGGLKCDEFGRVLNKAGEPIDGFYATGNCSGAVMGDSYPGAGSTIGPSMTFAYIAANHISNEMSKK